MPWSLPEKLEVGDGLGVVAHGVAELDHGLAEVREAVRVHLQLAGLQRRDWMSTGSMLHMDRQLGLDAAILTRRGCPVLVQ